MEVGGLLGGYSDVVLNKLAKIAKKYSVNEVVIEGNFGDGMYIKLFEPVLKKTYDKCGITEVKSSGQKELRIIDTLEPVISNHKMCVSLNVSGMTSLQSLNRITNMLAFISLLVSLLTGVPLFMMTVWMLWQSG